MYSNTGVFFFDFKNRVISELIILFSWWIMYIWVYTHIFLFKWYNIHWRKYHNHYFGYYYYYYYYYNFYYYYTTCVYLWNTMHGCCLRCNVGSCVTMVTILRGVTRQLADTPTPLPLRSFMPFARAAKTPPKRTPPKSPP